MNTDNSPKRLVGQYWCLTYKNFLPKIDYYEWFRKNIVKNDKYKSMIFICHLNDKPEVNIEKSNIGRPPKKLTDEPLIFGYQTKVLFDAGFIIDWTNSKKFIYNNNVPIIVGHNNDSWKQLLSVFRDLDKEIFPNICKNESYIMTNYDKINELNSQARLIKCKNPMCNEYITILKDDKIFYCSKCTKHYYPKEVKINPEFEKYEKDSSLKEYIKYITSGYEERISAVENANRYLSMIILNNKKLFENLNETDVKENLNSGIYFYKFGNAKNLSDGRIFNFKMNKSTDLNFYSVYEYNSTIDIYESIKKINTKYNSINDTESVNTELHFYHCNENILDYNLNNIKGILAKDFENCVIEIDKNNLYVKCDEKVVAIENLFYNMLSKIIFPSSLNLIHKKV